MQRYRTTATLILSIVTAISLISCTATNCNAQDPVSFVTKYAPITFTFPTGSELNTSKHPFDLQVFSENQDFNTGIFVFKDTDISKDSSPLEIFKKQIDDISSKRDNFQEIEPIKKSTLDDKTITTHTFAGDKTGASMCYHFSLIQFKNDESKFAVAYQISRRDGWPKFKAAFEKIIASAKPATNND